MDSRGGRGRKRCQEKVGARRERESEMEREEGGQEREREREMHTEAVGGECGVCEGGDVREKEMLGKVGAGRGVRKTAK